MRSPIRVDFRGPTSFLAVRSFYEGAFVTPACLSFIHTPHLSMSVQKINDVLSTLEDAIPSVIGTIVASGDGFVVTETLNGKEAEEIAAMVATTKSVSERMSATLSAGGVEETSIRSEDRSIFLYRASENGILAVIAESEANIGMIHLRARETAQAIGNQLTTRSAA